jgi:hypothetical protein
MSMPAIEGLWTHPSSQFPEVNNLMRIDELRGRIILFVPVQADPVLRTSSAIWFRRESPNSIAARLWGDKRWRLHTFEIQEDQIVWPVAGQNQVWRRVPLDQYPDWLESSVAKAYARMDEREAQGEVPGRSGDTE